MKKYLAFCLIALAIANTSSAQNGWKQIYPNRITVYHAMTADSVYVVDGFAIMLTADGGKSWEKKGSIPWLSDTVFALTAPDSARREYKLHDIYFLSANAVILSAQVQLNVGTHFPGSITRLLYFSNDGAKTWDTLKSEPDWGSGLAPIRRFVRLNNSQALGYGGMIWNNYEANFPLQSSFISFDGDSVKELKLDPMHFSDEITVLDTSMLLTMGSTSIIRSISGSSLDTIPVVRGSIAYLGNNTIVSNRGRSTDMGRTWESLSIPQNSVFWGSDFGTAWASTPDSLMKTIDAGIAWRTINNVTRFTDLESFDSSIAIGLTIDGFLMRTISGGWQLNIPGKSEDHHLAIYPNPAIHAVQSTHLLEWFDLLGRSFALPSEMIGDRYQYDVRGLNAGTYIVRHGESSQIVNVQR